MMKQKILSPAWAENIYSESTLCPKKLIFEEKTNIAKKFPLRREETKHSLPLQVQWMTLQQN